MRWQAKHVGTRVATVTLRRATTRETPTTAPDTPSARSKHPHKVFLPFLQARAFARSLRLSNRSQWSGFSKGGARPPNIPSNPNLNYRGTGWRGYDDWLLPWGDAPPDQEAFADARLKGGCDAVQVRVASRLIASPPLSTHAHGADDHDGSDTGDLSAIGPLVALATEPACSAAWPLSTAAASLRVRVRACHKQRF